MERKKSPRVAIESRPSRKARILLPAEWPSDGEHTHQSPARPTLEKTLRVPAEEADRPHSRQIQQAALDAVKSWRYKPYLLNGKAVEAQTFVTVNFRLPQQSLLLPATR